MKTSFTLLMVAIAAGFLLTYAMAGLRPSGAPSGTVTDSRTMTATTLPDFSFTTLDDRTMASRDLRGRAVLINFWATWCPPCVAEFPMLLELARRHPDRLVLLAISSDQNRAAIDRFFDRLPAASKSILSQDNVLIVLDHDSSLTFGIFRTALLPETIIVSPEMEMLHKIAGADWKPEDLAPHLPFLASPANNEGSAAQTTEPSGG